jgi:uncharacterized protein (DUF305 family)
MRAEPADPDGDSGHRHHREALAEKIVTDQQAEITTMQGLLSKP